MTPNDRFTLLRIEPDGDTPISPSAGGEPGGVLAIDGDPAPHGVTDPFAEIKTAIHQSVIDSLGPQLMRRERSGGAAAASDTAVRAEIQRALGEVDRPLSQRERERIAGDVMDDVIGYGPIEQYLRDESVTEVMVNAHDQVWIEREGRLIETSTRFADDAHVERIITKIVSQIGRRIDEASPMVDARLPDGSRVNAIIPPLALNGPCLTIRKFRTDPLTMDDLLELGTLTPQAAQFLELCVRGAANILVSGGTGSGKTTTLNVLSAAIPESERIVTIEDAAEMQLHQRHVIPLESRPANIEGAGQVSIRDLVRNSLRMRPDRIIVGECRGGEAVDMLQAMNTGHDGSMTTIHANGPRDALSRVETLVLSSGIELPSRAIRDQISSALHLVVHVARLVDGSRRITDISEVGRMESGVITMQDLFVARPPEGEEGAAGGTTRLLGPLRCTGIKPAFLDHLAANGVHVPDALFSPEDDGELRSGIARTRTRSRRRFERGRDIAPTSFDSAQHPETPTHTTTQGSNTMQKDLHLIARDEEGQTMAEYGVVLAVITGLVFSALALLSGNIVTKITEVAGIVLTGGAA